MTLLYEQRDSDSPYIETVIRGTTTAAGTTVRPAESHWHMVFSLHDGRMHPLFVGPLTTAGTASWGGDAEVLWIKFKLGTFMPHLPSRKFLDMETLLPEASTESRFWLKSSAWQFPNYENVDTFVERLVRDEILLHDPLVSAVLQGEPHDLSARTVRHRFLQSTGLTQTNIYQIERAARAAALLESGATILDTVDEVGYFDQPHLTRALRQWVGKTPAQIVRLSRALCQNVQDSIPLIHYPSDNVETQDNETEGVLAWEKSL